MKTQDAGRRSDQGARRVVAIEPLSDAMIGIFRDIDVQLTVNKHRVTPSDLSEGGAAAASIDHHGSQRFTHLPLKDSTIVRIENEH